MQSVRIEFPVKKRVDTSEFTELEGQLATALRAAKAGRVDGNEIESRSWTIFMYGRSADALFDAIQSVLKSCAHSHGATVTKQLGGRTQRSGLACSGGAGFGSPSAPGSRADGLSAEGERVKEVGSGRIVARASAASHQRIEQVLADFRRLHPR